MARSVTYLLLIVPLLLGIAGAQPSTHFPVRAGNLTVSNSSSNLTVTNATLSEISAAKAFLAQKLGLWYYDAYIHYAHGYFLASTNQTYVYFSYSIPLSSSNSTQGSAGTRTSPLYVLGVTVTLNKTTRPVGYFGPSDPYIITVPASTAVFIASSMGVKNGSIAVSYAVNPSELSPMFGYTTVWAVTGRDPILNYSSYNKTYPGLYISVQTGNVLGEYVYNPSAAVQGSNSTPAVLGRFGLFALNNTHPSQLTALNTSQQYNSTASSTLSVDGAFAIIAAAAVAGVLVSAVGFGLYYLLSRKRR